MHKTGTKALGDYGITTQQWAVLGALARPAVKKSGVSVKELMELLMTSRQNLTGVLDRLEAQGLIERSKGKGDGRIRHVRLTSVGAQTWTKMLFEIEAYYASAIAGFSTEESFLLLRLLDRLKLGLSAL